MYKAVVTAKGFRAEREIKARDQTDAVVQAVLFVQYLLRIGIDPVRAVLLQPAPQLVPETVELDLEPYLKYLRDHP